MRLPRKHTMKKRADFQKVRETGRSKAGRFLVLSTLEDPELPHFMVAFITTKKVGKAHDRNLLRRRFRSIIQNHAHRITPSLRYVVMIARYNTLTATYAELEQDWLKLAAKLGMLPPSSSPTS
ncbi:MAG: ribonuclease P protein component [Akkermansiaceae bacterium]